MLTDVRGSSLEAYSVLTESGREQTQCQRVLSYIESHAGCHRREIADGLGLPTATVSARVNALLKQGKVVEGERHRDPVTGIHTYTLIAPAQRRLI